jgi:hypothetical protein
MRVAPSIFATEPFQAMSDRYSFIPTIEIVERLRSKGWLPVMAREAKARTEGRFGYTKHMIRLRQTDAPLLVGDAIPEIVLLNSHDGGSAYQMLLGLFRLVCSNGLMVDSGSFEQINIRHSGDVINEVVYAAKHITKEAPKLVPAIKRMQAKQLTDRQKKAFSAAALELKYDRDEETGQLLTPISPDQILIPRRYADRSDDLWTSYNVIQENLIRGGIRGQSRNDTGRRVRTREVKSVSENIRLNRALWTLAQQLRK